MKVKGLTRRTLLRGVLQGSAISVGLPILDVFLNGNGTALASGAPLPLRFGTWFWGCGMTPERWNPQAEGAKWALTPELAALERHRRELSILSGFNVHLDGRPNQVHSSGVVGTLTGNAPMVPDEYVTPTLDVLIADAIGTGTRFRSLEIAASGDPRHSYSRRSSSVVNAAEVSPLALYQRVFGEGFQDPNAGEFRPDPALMMRQSVLSAVKEDRQRLMQQLGSGDRARLDQYFTAVRQAEQQLDIMLQEPEPLAACVLPDQPQEVATGTEIDQVARNHTLLAQLMALAVACDQTRVFNVVFSPGASNLRRAGSSANHHQLTHEESVDPALGYQPEATYFVERSMLAFGEFLDILKSVPEGDGTLLDNCAVLAHSETSLAKTHDVSGLPLMLAGRAGGRLRSGQHIKGRGDPVSRVGLTLQQLMGVPVSRWGTRSMETDRALTEVLV
ncbi:DUF1552 domain-containing protein [Parahaliea aestuarii]|uniref:DUF1552 domain-containing protein n=1 Tax=Parahaliea aestuarii TaxID=1852021 RepID=A0A5C8ZTR2_9GAMM|nr:DUF1552 domain-containing protein [Parahaliea aestuarii]TXS91189.1 DUF1552 domain-containing protein [Parahaliea aestuarii]